MTLAQDDTQIEEVVVTGSYIRRSEGFTQASSVVQFTAEDLEAEGTLNLGEVVQQMSFVNGKAASIMDIGPQGTDSHGTSVDLRGLGARSTLTLLDGKRLVNQNVNALLPTIAMQRIDIVADGAAALYGSEAVAGVVNFVPYRSYDGLKVETFAEGDDRGDWDQHSVQVLWGGDVGALDVVVAGQFRSQTRLGLDERSYQANSGNKFSSNAPGNWRAPLRDANGLYTGQYQNQPDPNCAPASERTGYTPNQVPNPFGMLDKGNCWIDNGGEDSYLVPEDHTKFFANATWEVNDDLTILAQGFRTRFYERAYGSTSNPGNSRIGELPAARGELPGNPFLAVNSAGQQLYGVDLDQNGIPDRGTADLNNDGWGDYIVSGIANNGVALREDVLARRLRPINKTHTIHDGLTSDYDNMRDSLDYNTRWTLQADFNVPFVEGWEGEAAYSQNRREYLYDENQNYDITHMIQGLNCDVINDRDACYNPFFVVNQVDNNSIQVMDAIAARGKGSILNTLDTIDLVFNGQIPLGTWELPGGPIGAAFGYQYRDDSFTNTPSEEELAGVAIRSAVRQVVTSGSRDVNSYFAELSLPILSNLEVSAAVRREEFSTGQESTDPKFGITYAPTDWLTLRATNGDAFIAPTLEQLLNPISCGLTQVTDRFTPNSAFITGCGGGNPNLTNETAESSQFGVDLNFGDFDFSVTWNNTEFVNRIVRSNGQQIAGLDFFNFQQVSGFSGDGLSGNQPTHQQLVDWVKNPASDKNIIRDPNDVTTILQVDGLGAVNAESVEVTAYDIAANYSFSLGNAGDVRIGLVATKIKEFMVQADATQPIFDAVGKQNDRTGAAPALPEWKANLRVVWNLNNHSLLATAHYTDHIEYDASSFTHLDRFANTYRNPTIAENGVRPWADMDLAYTYRGLSAFGSDFSFTLGSRNVFDRQAQRGPEQGGIIAELQDPLGRIIYGRMVIDF